jgi:CheY-like chemotaxis protein
MPELDGVECISQIRKKDLLVPIILTTGSQEAIEKDYSKVNINYKIKKPWSFESMLKVIQTLLN